MDLSRTNVVWDFPGFIVFSQLLNTRTWWTEELVNEFLSTPDRFESNPHNASQIMRLYQLDRVRKIEKSLSFKKRCIEINSGIISMEEFRKKSLDLKKQENSENKKRRLQWKRISNSFLNTK